MSALIINCNLTTNNIKSYCKLCYWTFLPFPVQFTYVLYTNNVFLRQPVRTSIKVKKAVELLQSQTAFFLHQNTKKCKYLSKNSVDPNLLNWLSLKKLMGKFQSRASLKFIYSEKATKVLEISTLDLTFTT